MRGVYERSVGEECVGEECMRGVYGAECRGAGMRGVYEGSVERSE
jgi:hypothetical protein